MNKEEKVVVCEQCENCIKENKVEKKTPIYTRWWLWVILVSVIANIFMGYTIYDMSTKSTLEDFTKKIESSEEFKNSDILKEFKEKGSSSSSKKEILEKAEFLGGSLNMSKEGLENYLKNNYSDKDIKYVFDNLDVDWNKNALNKAKTYKSLGLSDKEIKEKLVNENKFTDKQAEYALGNL